MSTQYVFLFESYVSMNGVINKMATKKTKVSKDEFIIHEACFLPESGIGG